MQFKKRKNQTTWKWPLSDPWPQNDQTSDSTNIMPFLDLCLCFSPFRLPFLSIHHLIHISSLCRPFKIALLAAGGSCTAHGAGEGRRPFCSTSTRANSELLFPPHPAPSHLTVWLLFAPINLNVYHPAWPPSSLPLPIPRLRPEGPTCII